MRRSGIYEVLGVIAVAAVAAVWMARRSPVVERPSLGGPPPQARQDKSLVGAAAPTFDAVDQSGRDVGSQALRGRVVVLNVWATWCPPCVQELPRIEREIWRRFQSDVTVVGIARGEDEARVRSFNRRMNLTFPLVADPDARISGRFGVDESIPRTYVISRSGVVVHQTLGYGEQGFTQLVDAVSRAVAK